MQQCAKQRNARQSAATYPVQWMYCDLRCAIHVVQLVVQSARCNSLFRSELPTPLLAQAGQSNARR
eukprot:4549172-Pyramimonas_sp.AAC.1